MALEHVEHLAVEAEPEEVALAPDDRGVDRAGEAQASPRLRRVARPDLRERLAGIERALDEHLDLAARVLDAVEPRLHDPRVVEHEHVAGREELREIGERVIGHAAGRKAQQPARRPRRGRMLRDQLGRQLVVEVVDGERGSCAAVARWPAAPARSLRTSDTTASASAPATMPNAALASAGAIASSTPPT